VWDDQKPLYFARELDEPRQENQVGPREQCKWVRPCRADRPLLKFAILIDAGFLKRKLGSHSFPLAVDGVVSFIDAIRTHSVLDGMRLHRVYWYDAPPLTGVFVRPLHGGRIDFGKTMLARSNALLFAAMRVLPFVSIRRGDLAFRGWRVRQARLSPEDAQVTLTAADLEPVIHQKGVDMRLGLDIASLTLKAHVSIIVLVTGDSDFVPAMKFARREGAQILLVTLGHPVRQEMLEHSDLVLELPPCATRAA
jgi:hypothetical protein